MNEYNIVFWNVENLFDSVNSSRRTEKLQRTIGKSLKGWTADIVKKKVKRLSEIIRKMNQGKGPDILGVCEVENKHVLELLKNELNSLNRHYDIAHHDTADHRGIDIAYIYDSSLFTAEDQFSHYIIKRSATRDLFQVNFRTKSNNLIVVVGNHWPARTAGQFESEPYRLIAGETLAYFHDRILEINGKDTAIIAMGDFNDEPFNRSLTDYARAKRIRKKVTYATSAKFLNLMWSISGQGVGSYYYNNEPNVLDQFLISKGIVTGKSDFTLMRNSVDILRFPEMVNAGRYPSPIRFGQKDKINPKGYSDHFPISLILNEK